MKVIAVAHRRQDASPEDFVPHLEREANQVLAMYRDEVIREEHVSFPLPREMRALQASGAEDG